MEILVTNEFQKTQLSKKHFPDAGLDIRSAVDIIVPAGGRVLVSTELFISIPVGMVGEIKSRSGLAVKHGITAFNGIIDGGYLGEVKVLLFNHSDKYFAVNKGDRIAQLLTSFVALENYTPVTEFSTETARSDNGFGSSGVK